MWQSVRRISEKYRLEAKITSFVPMDHDVELMQVELKNCGDGNFRLCLWRRCRSMGKAHFLYRFDGHYGGAGNHRGDGGGVSNRRTGGGSLCQNEEELAGEGQYTVSHGK